MKHIRPVFIALAASLAGCASNGSMGFMHLEALANSGNSDSQVTLAHAYADPARFPDRAPAKADMVEAVKWCYLAAQTDRSATAACADVMKAATPEQTAAGQNAAVDWLEASQPWNRLPD
jgi:hypothetical protein